VPRSVARSMVSVGSHVGHEAGRAGSRKACSTPSPWGASASRRSSSGRSSPLTYGDRAGDHLASKSRRSPCRGGAVLRENRFRWAHPHRIVLEICHLSHACAFARVSAPPALTVLLPRLRTTVMGLIGFSTRPMGQSPNSRSMKPGSTPAAYRSSLPGDHSPEPAAPFPHRSAAPRGAVPPPCSARVADRGHARRVGRFMA